LVTLSHNIIDITRLESVQRVFTKRLGSCAGQTYSERLTTLGLSTLELRRLHADLVFCYKILHGIIKLNIDDLFVLELSTLTCGHCWKLRAVKPRLDYRLHFFAYRTVRAWNSLSNNTVSGTSVKSFMFT